MSKTQIERKEDGTIKFTITIPHDVISKTTDEVLGEMAQSTQIPGFRKGKAPQKLVAEQLNPDQVRENILKKILPQAYAEAVEANNIKPIMNPKLHVEKIEDGKEWVISALTCEMPSVELGNYKDSVKKITAKSRIVIPGKEEEQKKPSLDDIIKAILEKVKVQVPEILIEQETDRLLSQLLDDVKRLGLSLEQYLGTTKRSAEDLRKEYAQRAETDIKVEFVLQKIAEQEKISVEPQEIEEAIQKAKDPKEKQNLEANRYLLAGILRQQKTLDFLMNL
jgi:FKBP-type peptidyl-prolyl cis-trans isomerase (trigger factor)